MPYARARDGTRLYYELAGGGLDAPAVLLVMGLALRGEVWGATREALASAGYRTITMDNRGAGESHAASWDFSTSTMADDAIAVMRDAFVARAHVVGVSLGGMVAQEIALRHAARVGALVLQSTFAGRPRVHHIAPALPLRSAAMVRSRVTRRRERRERIVLRVLTTRRFARTADLEDPAIRGLLDAVEAGVSVDGYLGQVTAAWSHRAWRRLTRITAPTLIQHGTRDGLIRARAARVMAAKIPGAQLDLYPDAGHALNAQCPQSLDVLREFLRTHDGLLERPLTFAAGLP